MKLKQKAVLIGPYIGCYQWELSAFVPHVLSLIKENRSYTYIVFTRPEMFDFYGKYVDIVVPLRFPENKDLSLGYTNHTDAKSYNELSHKFRNRFVKRYNIVDIIKPEIEGFMHGVKWQFKRNGVLFSFRPREKNKKIVKELYGTKKYIITDLNNLPTDKDVVTLDDLYEKISTISTFNYNFSFYGCVIELLRNASLFIGTTKTIYNLSLLMGVPTILTEEITGDEISLINPLKTKTIVCSDAKEGLEFYENNI